MPATTDSVADDEHTFTTSHFESVPNRSFSDTITATPISTTQNPSKGWSSSKNSALQNKASRKAKKTTARQQAATKKATANVADDGMIDTNGNFDSAAADEPVITASQNYLASDPVFHQQTDGNDPTSDISLSCDLTNLLSDNGHPSDETISTNGVLSTNEGFLTNSDFPVMQDLDLSISDDFHSFANDDASLGTDSAQDIVNSNNDAEVVIYDHSNNDCVHTTGTPLSKSDVQDLKRRLVAVVERKDFSVEKLERLVEFGEARMPQNPMASIQQCVQA